MKSFCRLCCGLLFFWGWLHAQAAVLPENFHSVDISGAHFGRALHLKSVSTGKYVQLTDYRGKILIVYFGFSHCQTACPIAMAQWHAVFKEMKNPEDMQLLFVTIDPQRDTPSVLRKYVRRFGFSSFDGLVGSKEEIDQAAKEFHVYFHKMMMPMTDQSGQKTTMSMRMPYSGYTIDHSAASYVYDKKGRIRLLVRSGMKTEEVVSDLNRLKKETK